MNYEGMKSKNEALDLVKKYNKNCLIIKDKEETIENTKNIISKLETAEEFFMQYNLYKAQKDRGLKISIDGHGSDEFLGYPHYLPELSVDIFNNLINTQKTLLSFAGESPNQRFKKLFGIGEGIPNQIQFIATPNTFNYFKDYIDCKEYDSSFQIINEDLEHLKDFSYSLGFTYLISYCGWFQFFLNKWDKASMSNSIEVRMPFLDTKVRLFGLALNTEHKIKNSLSKSILRDAFKDHLPASILNQNYKQGLSQHKFNLSSAKYDKFIKTIISEKNFKDNGLWDKNKILKDFKNNKNKNIIWRLCKYYLMLEGFRELNDSIKINDLVSEKYNLLNTNL